MKTILAAISAAAMLSGSFSVHAQTADPAAGAPLSLPLEGDISKPSWTSVPSADDLSREYPRLALTMNISGQALILCQAEPDGRVDECRIGGENPAGLGFGAAALRLAAYFTMNPARVDGKPVKSRINIPIRFALGQDTQTVEPETPAPASSPAALEWARKIVAAQNYPERIRAQLAPTLNQMSAGVVVDGDARSGERALDALRQGLEDTIAEQMELRARHIAGTMSEADLRATAAYLDTPAGKAWMAADTQTDAIASTSFRARLAQASRARLCAQIACPPAPPTP